jgi:fructose/tagatose bisphosphate aldolase
MILKNYEQLKTELQGILKTEGPNVRVLDEKRLSGNIIDDLVQAAVFSHDNPTRDMSRWIIRRTGAALGILPASIQSLYDAMGRGEAGGFTVPAINIRGLTYDSAQAVFRAALKGKVGPFIFEIARSEIGYTGQRPAEYTTVITAAAIKTGYRGPLFLQGDHFQISAGKFSKNPEGEVNAVKDLIREAIAAGFFNIDIDSSTIVDLSKPSIKEQQRNNYEVAAELTKFIRGLEPKGITVSVGGEIGEVGGKNSTVEDLRAFMDGYNEVKGVGLKGISKISIQTGTSHGGVPLPDGTIARVSIDFEALEKISAAARSEYGLAGAVQHGASTLPDEAFDRFPKTGTAEIHLATGFQNMIYDSPAFPEPLRKIIYDYVRTDLIEEKKAKDTDEQFIYKTRKKGFGPYKQQMWDLPDDVRRAIGRSLEEKFDFLFSKLEVCGTAGVVEKFVKPVDVPLGAPGADSGETKPLEEYGEGE